MKLRIIVLTIIAFNFQAVSFQEKYETCVVLELENLFSVNNFDVLRRIIDYILLLN